MRMTLQTIILSFFALTNSKSFSDQAIYEFTGTAFAGVFGFAQNPIADVLGVERNSTPSIPVSAKFVIDLDLSPYIENGSPANGGEFIYRDSLVSASIMLNGTCFSTIKPIESQPTPTPSNRDEAQIGIVYSPTALNTFGLGIKGRGGPENADVFNTYTVPVNEVVKGQLINSAEVFVNIVNFIALGTAILDNEKIPDTGQFFDNATAKTILFQLGAIPDVGIGHGVANVSVLPGTASSLKVTTNPISPIPKIKVNSVDDHIVLSEGSSGSISISMASNDMESMCMDWWAVLAAPSGWYNYQLSSGSWVYAGTSPLDVKPSYQGPLTKLASYKIANTDKLGSGRYVVYFGVDTRMNGRLDLESISYDSVVIDIQ